MSTTTQHARTSAGQPPPAATPRDYAELNAIWLALLAATVAATREGAREPVTNSELAQLSMASFALSKAVAREKIGSWVREPFVEEETPGERHPRGRRLRAAVGELLTCTRCVGTWSALGLVGLRLAHPPTGRVGHDRARHLRGQRLATGRLPLAVQQVGRAER